MSADFFIMSITLRTLYHESSITYIAFLLASTITRIACFIVCPHTPKAYLPSRTITYITSYFANFLNTISWHNGYNTILTITARLITHITVIASCVA